MSTLPTENPPPAPPRNKPDDGNVRAALKQQLPVPVAALRSRVDLPRRFLPADPWKGQPMFRINKLRAAWANTRRSQRHTRNDEGFSFAQVIVTMVIVGILGGAIGFTAFQFIGQSRETVLAANIRTAADAVQNTLALNPDLKTATGTTGVPGAGLLSELGNVAGFTWDGSAFPFAAGDGIETVRIQMIEKGTATAPIVAANAPSVSWLVEDFDAVRIQIRNEDGAWACALIVLRPDWATGTADEQAQAEGNLRGIWYDAGANIPTAAAEIGGRHHCSPATLGAVASHVGGGRTAATPYKDPLPVDSSGWTIPYDVSPGLTIVPDPGVAPGDPDVPGRLLERTVPGFDA